MTGLLGPRAVLRAMGAARKENDLEAALRYIAPESLDQGQSATREDWRRKWEQMRAGSPGMEVITEHSVEDGEWVAHRYTIRGTQGRLVRPAAHRETLRDHGNGHGPGTDGQLVEHWAFAGPLRAR